MSERAECVMLNKGPLEIETSNCLNAVRRKEVTPRPLDHRGQSFRKAIEFGMVVPPP